MPGFILTSTKNCNNGHYSRRDGVCRHPRGPSCVWPFTHNNVTYNSCAQTISAFDEPSCMAALLVDGIGGGYQQVEVIVPCNELDVDCMIG